jgi:ATP-dependent DNA helicase RecG
MRYEDETAIIPMHDAALRGGSTVQVEGVVTASDVQYRPRRQLVVTISDDSGQVVLRFLNFYGSQLKQLAMGARQGTRRIAAWFWRGNGAPRLQNRQ